MALFALATFATLATLLPGKLALTPTPRKVEPEDDGAKESKKQEDYYNEEDYIQVVVYKVAYRKVIVNQRKVRKKRASPFSLLSVAD